MKQYLTLRVADFGVVVRNSFQGDVETNVRPSPQQQNIN